MNEIIISVHNWGRVSDQDVLRVVKAAIQRAIKYENERDEDSAYSLWATDDGIVYIAHDIDLVSEWEEKERNFFEVHYPDIRGWNLPEFQEHLVETKCIYQLHAASATALLLQHGSAYTYAQLWMTGNLPEESRVMHHVVIQ